MELTSSQRNTFKTWLTANAAGLSDDDAANLSNAAASPTYLVWRRSVDKSIVDALIDKALFTPTDAVPGSPSTDMTYQNRALLCQLKQTNAQWLTVSNNQIDARSSSTRKNFQDCLRQIPSGASGANSDAGWGAPASPGPVRLAMQRPASNVERLFVVVSSGPGNTGGDARGSATNPDVYGVGEGGSVLEGSITSQQVAEIRG